MQFCDDHWTALREALDERGLSHLIRERDNTPSEAKTIEDVINIDLVPTVKSFDPLLYSFWCITANVLHFVGVELFSMNEDGTDKCPICYIAEDHAERCTNEECDITTYDHWIDAAADDALVTWEELKAKERGDVRVVQ